MENMLIYLFKSSICLSLLWLSYWTLLRNERCHNFNRFFLLSSLLISVVIPSLKLDILPAVDVSPEVADYTFTFDKDVIVSTTVVSPALSAVTEKSDIYLSGYFLVVLAYILGWIFFFIRFFIRLSNTVKMLKANDDKSDIAFTFFRKIKVGNIPNDANSQNLLLLHEKVHATQLHSADILFAEIVAVFHWFNPLVWRYCHSLKEVHEFLADSKVIAQDVDEALYIRLMYHQATGIFPEFTNGFSQSLTKKRLVMMYQNEKSHWHPLRIAIAIIAVAATSVSFAAVRKECNISNLHLAANQSVKSDCKLIVKYNSGKIESFFPTKAGQAYDLLDSLNSVDGTVCFVLGNGESSISLVVGGNKKAGLFSAYPKGKKRNKIDLLINGRNWLMMNEKRVTIDGVVSNSLKYLRNQENNASWPLIQNCSNTELGSYKKYHGVIVLQFDRGTDFNVLCLTMAKCVEAFNILKDELASDAFKVSYTKLSEPQQKAVDEAIPYAIYRKVPRNSFGMK